MAGRQRRLPQFKGLAVQALSICKATGSVEQASEVVQAGRDVGVLMGSRCAPQIQGLAQQGLCFAPIAPSLKATSKRIQRLWRMALLE